MRKIKLSFIFTMLLFSSFSLKKEPLQVEAARGSMPTTISTLNQDDAYVNNYYASVSGKKGSDLVDGLYDIIKDHEDYDYDSSSHRTIFKIIDRNWELSPLPIENNTITNFNYNTDDPYINKLYGDYNNDPERAFHFNRNGDPRIASNYGVSFDKEHIWPQSLGNFGRTGGAGADFHSLWPSDAKANQQGHSNYSFGIPTTNRSEVKSDDGTIIGYNGSIPGYANKVFEPLDMYKGDIARALFYMPARYNVYVGTLYPKLELVNDSPNAHTATTSVTGKSGVLDTLLSWNELDPVSDYEIHRNNLIYNNYQKNRNPFIDHPEWARIAYDASYDGTGASTAPGSSSVGDGEVIVDPTPTPTLTSISLDTTMVAKSFDVNDTFNTQNLVVTAHYDDEESSVVTNYEQSLANGSLLKESGTFIITITYTENEVTKSATYQISVKEIKQGLSTTEYILIGAAVPTVGGLSFLFILLRKKFLKV